MPDGIPSPNPEYPQPIKNVTGNANVKIQNKNLLNITDGNTLTTKSFDITDFVEVGKTYSFSAYLDLKNTTTTAQARLRIDKYIGTEISYLGGTLIANKSKGISKRENVTLESSVTKVVLTIQSYGVADFNCDYSQIMGEEGTTATTYVPHQEQNYPFSLKSKNLFNPNGEFENGYYNLDGTFTSSSVWRCITLNCKQGDTFVKSGAKWGGNVTFWNNDTFVSGINSSSVTIPSGVNKVKFACQYPFNGDEQLEVGSTATDYEPYYDIKAMQGTTLQDDGIHNKWYEESLINRNWAKYTNTDSQGNTFGFFMNLSKIPKRDITATNFAKCNILIQKQRTKVTTSDEEGFYLGDGTNALFIKIRQSLIPNGTIEELQTLLSNTNAKIQFEVPEEDIIPYNATQQAQYNAIKNAKSYDDQTNISQTYDELPFILDIEALKGKTNNEVNLLNSNNKKTAEYLETSLEQEEIEKIEEVEEPKEVEIQEEERVDTEENTENTAENAENSAESEEE